jgi:spore coat protein CotH
VIAIEIKKDQLKMLHKAVQKAGKHFPRELAAAVNTVTKQTRTDIGKRIRGVMKIKKVAKCYN